MAKISFILTASGTINAVANSKSYVIPKDHTNYAGIKDALKNDDADALERLANVAKTFEKFAAPVTVGGKVTVKDGTVFWGDQPMHNAVTDRILQLQRDGFPIEPMCRFMENLMKNPSRRSVQELYKFLDRSGLPITEDGCFLAYKRVNDDYKDYHSGTYLNKPGTTLEMPRNDVDDDFRNACSYGFHVGAIEYVRGFHSGSGHVLICKVNPADVVSVPEDANCTKVRTAKYEVLSEYDRNLVDALPDTLHTADGTPAAKPDAPVPGDTFRDDDTDDEYDDEEYDDDGDDEEDEDEDEEEDDAAVLERLTKLAEDKGVNPIILAFKLDVEKHRLSESPTVREVLEEALEDTTDPERVEFAIERL